MPTALLAVAALFALDTSNTTLVVENRDGLWRIPYYGAKADAAGVAALEGPPVRWHGDTRHAAYAAFGQPLVSMDVDKFGGLAVRHADGVLTTDLRADAGLPVEVPDAPGVRHVVLKHRDRVYPLFVDQHLRADAASDVIETWVEIRHAEKGPVALARMDSLALDLPRLARSYRLLTLSSWWGSEAKLSESDLARSQTITVNSRNGVRGAWDANPAFMLQFDGAATESAGRVLGGVLGWGGAWRMSFKRDWGDVVQVCAGADNGAGPYVLEPGRTLRTPDFMFTWSDRGRGQVSRNFHRWARTRRLPHGTQPRDVLLNSWEGSYLTFRERTLTDMMDGVKAMGGELFVLDDGWFGEGAFARDHDVPDHPVKGEGGKCDAGLGDWQVNRRKLPHGIAGLIAEAHRRGLKFGLWYEPEMVNTHSRLYAAHPDWAMREPTRPMIFGRGGTQCVLDLANPAVVSNLCAQLHETWKLPGLAYVKWDANANIFNQGSPYLGRDRQANAWFDYTVGLYTLLDRLTKAHPATVIQACSSGGGRMDYGFLKYADEFWVSDDSDARERVFMQWGCSHFYPACAMAAHVTASPNHQTRRTTPLKFRFDVAMSGRLGFELHPKDLSPDEVTFAKRCVADYKRLRHVIQQGDLYRLVAPYGDSSYASLMYVAPDQAKAVVFVWGLNRGPNRDFPALLRLAGLDPARRYRIDEINMLPGAKPHAAAVGKTLTGAALMNFGLEPWLASGDYDSCVLRLTAEPAPLDVRAFGAKGDGKAKDTAAIQAAIDAAEKAGGGEVFLGPGTYLSGSIYLKDGVDLHLGAGATLLGSPDVLDYNDPYMYPLNYGVWPQESAFGAHLLVCYEKKRVTVRGPGRIDGNARHFLLSPEGKVYAQHAIPWRPTQMLWFAQCEDVRVEDLEIYNSTQWSCLFHGCDRVKVRGCRVRNNRFDKGTFHTHNGDGIDIDCCRDVSVSDCDIATADDSITLRASPRGPMKNRECCRVTVANCRLSSPCNAIRVGVGEGRIHDAVLSNLTIRGSAVAFNVVSSWGAKSRGCDFENIRFENCTVDCERLCQIFHNYAKDTTLDGLVFSNIRGTSVQPGRVLANAAKPFGRIVFRNVDLDCGVILRNAPKVAFEGGRLREVSMSDAEIARTQWNLRAKTPWGDCWYDPRAGRTWRLVWSDEFNGTALDRTKWDYELGIVRNEGTPHAYTDAPRNVRVENGNLVLEVHKERVKNPKYKPGSKSWREREYSDYSSGSVTTLGKFSFTYGKLEVRAKVPFGRGMWPAAWMMGDNIRQYGWPACGELDVMEWVGSDPTTVFGTMHWYDPVKGRKRAAFCPGWDSFGQRLERQKPWDGFHVYAIEWDKDSIVFLYDGIRYFTYDVNLATVKGMGPRAYNPFRNPMFLILNLAMGGDWAGAVDDAHVPGQYLIDWVRVYERVPAEGEKGKKEAK